MRALPMVVFVAACSGSSNPAIDAGTPVDATLIDAGVPIVVGPGVVSGTVRGTVENAATGGAIVGAAVSLAGGAPTVTSGDGSFTVGGNAGRAELVVSSPGYLEWRRVVAVGGVGARRRVRLVPRATDQTVGVAGGTVTTSGATLEFPAGAYAADEQVSATWISNSQIGAAPGVVQFEDGDGRHRVVGVIHIEASAQPSVGATLRVPIPAEVPPAQVALYELGDGDVWGDRLDPSDTSGGMATFTVTHFSDYAETWEEPPPAAVCTDSGEEAFEIVGDELIPLVEGDAVELGNSVGLPPQGSATVVDPEGNELTVSSTSDTISEVAHYLTFGLFGKAVEFIFPPDSPSARLEAVHRGNRFFKVRTRSATFGTRGTTFSVDLRTCQGTDREIVKLEVVEGEMDITAGDHEPVIVAEGERATHCDGCPDPESPVCCELESCDTGCCDVDGCLSGDTDDACGSAGSACTACVAGMECNVEARVCEPGGCEADAECPTGNLCDGSAGSPGDCVPCALTDCPGGATEACPGTGQCTPIGNGCYECVAQ